MTCKSNFGKQNKFKECEKIMTLILLNLRRYCSTLILYNLFMIVSRC